MKKKDKIKMYYEEQFRRISTSYENLQDLVIEYQKALQVVSENQIQQQLNEDNEKRILGFILQEIHRAWGNLYNCYDDMLTGRISKNYSDNKKFPTLCRQIMQLIEYVNKHHPDFELEFFEKEKNIKYIMVDYHYILKLHHYHRKQKKLKKLTKKGENNAL